MKVGKLNANLVANSHIANISQKTLSVWTQGLVAIFLLVKIFHIIYDYTIKGAIDENKVLISTDFMLI